MIKRAKEINADFSKFQLYNDDIIKDSKDYKFLKSIMLDYDKAKELFDYGKSIGQEVFFTPMYPKAITEICEKLRVNYYKIRFADRDNKDIYIPILATKVPCFRSINHRDKLNWDATFCVSLYCVSKYPALPYQYKRFFEGNKKYQGFSDHSKGLKLLKEAYNSKVEYFEKHLMLSGTHPLEEKWSCTFKELNRILKNLEGKTRVCSQCYKEKELSKFYKDKNNKYDSRCRTCQNKASKQWYNSNKFYRFLYLEERRDHYKQLNKILREKNKEKRDNQIKEWTKKQIIKAENINSLSALHRYVKRHKEEPSFCMICNKEKKLELASLNHIYTRNPNDYFYICRSCHSIFDHCRKQLAEVLK